MTWYVVDGMDGCGKSTCAELLKEKLESEGRRVRLFSHPDSGCLFGRLEYGYLLKEGRLAKMLATVFFILDAVDSLFKMRLSSRKYDDFIFVRYLMSVAYLPDGIYRKAYRIIKKLFPMPDEFILVDVDAETSLRRIEARGEERESFENMDDLVRTREKMLSLSDGWFVVDNTLPLEEVKRLIEDHASAVLSGMRGRVSPSVCARGTRRSRIPCGRPWRSPR
ncbi:MAG: thymidylate kinase [Candidatus Methanomethylophilaceae archaeon]|nr:thymidylate kinase [Candidatus Methanomethylophilaceae archaeon]